MDLELVCLLFCYVYWNFKPKYPSAHYAVWRMVLSVQSSGEMWFRDSAYASQHQQKPAQSSFPVTTLTQLGSECFWWKRWRWWRYAWFLKYLSTSLNRTLKKNCRDYFLALALCPRFSCIQSYANFTVVTLVCPIYCNLKAAVIVISHCKVQFANAVLCSWTTKSMCLRHFCSISMSLTLVLISALYDPFIYYNPPLFYKAKNFRSCG